MTFKMTTITMLVIMLMLYCYYHIFEP